jgi:hypothetical protein
LYRVPYHESDQDILSPLLIAKEPLPRRITLNTTPRLLAKQGRILYRLYLAVFPPPVLAAAAAAAGLEPLTREYLRGKYHCTVDLLFDWFGLGCFAIKNKNCQLSYS